MLLSLCLNTFAMLAQYFHSLGGTTGSKDGPHLVGGALWGHQQLLALVAVSVSCGDATVVLADMSCAHGPLD